MQTAGRTEQHPVGGDLDASDGFPEQGDGVRVSRRQFIRGAAVLSALAAAGGGWWGMTRRLVLERVALPLRGLRAPLRIAMVTDTHLRSGGALQPFTNERMVSEALSMVADERPDLFLFGGDLTSETFGGGGGSARRMIDLMAGIEPPLGSYACLGNHDMTAQSGDTILGHYASSSVRLLEDEWVVLDTSAGPLSLGGLGYRGSGYEDAAPLGETRLPRPRILLAHDPTCVLYLDDLDRIDLIVCGHTHGGQVHLPLVGAPWTPSPAYPTYYRGLKALTPRSYIYVSRGVGTVFVPLRVGARPEVTVFDLSPLPESGEERESI